MQIPEKLASGEIARVPVYCDVVIFDPLGRIILIADGEMKYGDSDPDMWCSWKMPRYALPGKELPVNCIRENITAETGIVVKPMSSAPVGLYTTYCFDEPRKPDSLHMVYVAESAEYTVMPNQQFSTGFSVDQILDLKLKGKITDSALTMQIIMDVVDMITRGEQFRYGSVQIPPPAVEGECKVIG